MGYPPVPIAAGQDVTASQVNAMSRYVTSVTGATCQDTTSETVIGTATIPATDAGLASGVTGAGYCMEVPVIASTTSTPTLLLRVRSGSVTGTTICSFGTITCQSNLSGGLGWVVLKLYITATGSSGTFYNFGWQYQNFQGSPYVTTMSAQAGSSVNTTQALTLVLTATWGTASSSNTVTGYSGAVSRI